MRLPALDARGWLDGHAMRVAEMSLPLTDPAVHVGLGAFETLLVREGRVFELEEHLGRLEHSAARVAVPLPERESIRRTVLEAACTEETSWAWLKILATRGGHWAVLRGPLDPAEAGRPMTAVVLPWRRSLEDPLAGVKSTSYAHNEIGLEYARQRGADEGLWRNARGHLTEGCSSNLFVVCRRRLFTPAEREGLLGGVVRACVLRAAHDLGCTVHEGRLRLPRLFGADEAFLTSSLRGVRALVRCDRHTLASGEAGPVTSRLAAAVERLRLDHAVDARGALRTKEQRA